MTQPTAPNNSLHQVVLGQDLAPRPALAATKELGALWGKSAGRAGGRRNLLLSHLLDAAAVGELIWDRFLAVSTRGWLDDVAAGEGRRLFSWLCGVHDCGKATPAFQRLDPDGARAVRAAGLVWRDEVTARTRWRHDRAGGNLIRGVLTEAGWDATQVDWVWPLVAGHHGVFPSAGALREPVAARGELQGRGRWSIVQRALVETVTAELGFTGLREVQPRVVPSRAEQLHLSGLVVMADWIASDERHFTGVDELPLVGMEHARARAVRAWRELGLRGGWGALDAPGADFFQARFGRRVRPAQRMVVEAARAMGEPGLLVVEAPMGEGKTEAALAAVEVLAARFGADGVFVGMPTQATSDPMFTRVRDWASRLTGDVAGGVEPEGGPAAQVALLHGKRMFNPQWRALLEAAGSEPDRRFRSVDEHAPDQDTGQEAAAGALEVPRQAPAQWFLGRHRGLLCPLVVGTVDQMLFAATRTRHVMLRMAGLLGKVVVLDEVHAVDVYMSQFLAEALRWLGQARVPVVVLSATLPPGQRRALVEAYLAGAASREQVRLRALPAPCGYPCVTAAWWSADRPQVAVHTARSWRADLPVTVELLPERVGRTASERRQAQHAADEMVAEVLQERLAEGGCALVIRNTVGRAQSLYEVLRDRFGPDARLLHARFTASDRADRTATCLNLLGPPAPGGQGEGVRPDRMVLVATQLAEQSFDVDADFLVTDLAPIDLLLQRIGRLHRHAGVRRPAGVREPRVFVTGFALQEPGPPRFLKASEFIYGRHLLLRTAAALGTGPVRIWQVPSRVPALVRQVYGGARLDIPAAWIGDATAAEAAWAVKERERIEKAGPYLLTRLGEHENRTLAGLHYAGAWQADEETLRAVVRDAEPTVEVILVVGSEDGYRTLAGTRLGADGEVPSALLDEVLGATVRLPPYLTPAAYEELEPLPAWSGHAWLRYSRALVLDRQHQAALGGFTIRYDGELGLVVDRPPSRAPDEPTAT